ncbi:MAG: Ig-like domain-containing protein, partial [Acidimicrobiia bacterium]|nr:Ig-like domain-containing protein [Acidimicrobiia bacterium]
MRAGIPTRRSASRFTSHFVAFTLVAGMVASAPLPVGAASCDEPVVNEVACENTKPGSPASEWDIVGAGSSSIQGFATNISVDQGETVRFKIDTTASSYRLDIYRMGYYDGDGARLVASVAPFDVRSQPSCLEDSSTGLIDCGNWAESASWDVPVDAVSGIYFARLVRTDGPGGASHVFFVVRDDDGGSDLLFQTADTTWQAYNQYGGNSLYVGAPDSRAYKVSYNRPFTTREYAPEDWVFNAEYPMVRFLEANGFDVSYTTGVDTDRRGAELLEHSAFLSVGHDEYWSGQQRANVEAARDAGVDLAFFSGNEVFWKTRWEQSIDGSGSPYRTLVSYKETAADAVIDPAHPVWTGTWRDARFSPPADGGRPENGLTGQWFRVNCCAIDMEVGAEDGNMRFWRDTRVAALTGNQTTTVGTDIIGYEWDEDPDNGFRPAGLFRLSETLGTGQQVLLDEGWSYGTGNATHSMTMYRAPSGALVFGAGTIQWSWALDSNHDRGSAPADAAAQQATVNLFADMGAQPSTLQPGLVTATASTDVTPPTSVIDDPADGSTVNPGSSVTVTGTAADVGGNVGGVEVSTDGGTTWSRADGRSNWSYSFTAPFSGTVQVRARATDDSGNIETPGSAVTLTIDGATSCPCSIWSPSTLPERVDQDRNSVEVGV